MFAASIGRDQRAVVAAGDDAKSVRSAGEDAAGMNGHALFALFGCEEQVFFAQNENRCSAEKMHADDGAARRDRADAVGERGQRGGGGVGCILQIRGRFRCVAHREGLRF